MSKVVPKLRFKEFKDDWKHSKLGEIAYFSKGKGLSKSDIVPGGITECIRYGELYTHYGETIDKVISRTNVDIKDLVLSDANDVIIPASGETQIDIATASCVLRDGVALGGDLNIIKTKNNGVFLSYYLNSKRKKDIASLAQGISVVHLYSGQLALLGLNIPSVPEQQKIAAFLRAVDEKIQQLTRKKELLEQYKKGVMQQLFPPVGGQASGKLRFKDTNGKLYPKWEEKRLEDICSFFSGGTPQSTNKNYYSGSIPFIGSGNIYDSEVSTFISEEALDNSSAKLVEKGDLLFALYGANSGEVAISKINGAINQAILCIRTEEDTRYLYYLLFHNQGRIVAKYLQGGQGNLSAVIVRKLKYKFPSIEEQQKIASFLTALDGKIESVNQQIAQTQTFKKGLLQQMFV